MYIVYEKQATAERLNLPMAIIMQAGTAHNIEAEKYSEGYFQ